MHVYSATNFCNVSNMSLLYYELFQRRITWKKKKTWTIELADGTTLEGLTLNGNNYVSKAKLTADDFDGNLSHVKITDGETTQEMTGAQLVQCQQYGNEYCFILREPTPEETAAARTQADIKYIAMMADIDLKEV